MAKFMRPYARALRERYRGFVPIQAVGQQLEPGDLIVMVTPRAIKRRGHIRDFDIEHSVLPPAGNHNFGISSDEKLSFSAKVKGKPPAEWSQFGLEDVGLSVRMTSRRAFYMKAQGVEFVRLANPHAVYTQVKNAFFSGDWPPKLMVVDSVIKANRYVLGISSSNEGIFEVGLNTDDPAVTPTGANLLDLGVDVVLRNASQVHIDTVSNTESVFAFMATRLALRTTGTTAPASPSIAADIGDMDEVAFRTLKGLESSVDFDIVDSSDFADSLDFDEELSV